MVATLAVETLIDGEPAGASKVRISPAMVKSAPLKTRPPMVMGPAKVAVPAVPVK